MNRPMYSDLYKGSGSFAGIRWMMPGDVRRICRDGHVFDVMMHRESWRVGTWRVVCRTCCVVVHPTTSDPEMRVDYHVRYPADSDSERLE